MSHNRFQFQGLQDLFEGLRNLPPELQAEGGEIVVAHAEAAQTEIQGAYPSRTGNLRDHVTVKTVVGQFSTNAIVKNTAKHAVIFENGTQARHTDLGAARGSMPPGHVFVPVVIRRRRAMYEALKGLIAKKGLVVSGDA